MGSIISRINGTISDLPISERRVAEYILSSPNDINKMTVHEVAEKSGSSSASVVRFCRSIGLSGFPDLKIRLSVDSVKPRSQGYFDVEKNEQAESVIDKLLSNTVEALRNTADYLNENVIQETVQLLDNAPIIYVYGVGASSIVAEDFAQKWMRLGKHVYHISDAHVLAMALSTAQENAVFFGISYSGETREVIELMQLAKEYGLKTIGLSRMGDNTVTQIADVSLHTTRAPEAEFRSAATSSRLAQLFIVDVLFYTYASSHYDFAMQQFAKSRQAIDVLKKK
ncbi:MAG: MurR/RpiR family transcriptional regulator [Bacilli bacterium]